jgi:hypothetical protein
MVFVPETLTSFDRIVLPVLMWFCIVSHATHLLLTGFILVLLAVLLVLRRRTMEGRGRALATVAIVLVIAAASQLTLHKFLYGRASLDGNRLPYLSARFIADGPEREYLQTHCATEHWVLCANVDRLPSNDDEFIWGDDTIWTRSSQTERKQMLREEVPLIVRTVRTYPKQQIGISLHAFLDQLNDFGVNDFDNNMWMEDHMEETMTGAHATYECSLQAHDHVPSEFFTELQRWPVYAAAVALVVFVPLLMKLGKRTLPSFCVVIVPTLIVNAFLAATLSEVDSRFQARVIWLLPLLALIAGMVWWSTRDEQAQA